jgi:hypothetical protein
MAIEVFHARSEVDAVSFYKDHKIRFSTSLVKRFSLDKYNFVELAADDELHRLYFSFHSEPLPGLVKLYQIKDKTGGRFVAVRKLAKQYDWINKVFDETNRAKKQFVPEVTEKDSKYNFFVTIGYAFSNARPFADSTQYPTEPGVYRLWKDDEVVRIGESNNIAERLKQHFDEYGGQMDNFDFEIVPKKDERTKEQARLLASFKTNIGRLPKLNPIMN